MIGLGGGVVNRTLSSLKAALLSCRHALYPYCEKHISWNAGIAFLLMLLFCNSIMATACKLLVSSAPGAVPIHPVQILWMRMLVTFACCVLYMYWSRSVPDLPWGPPRSRPLLMLRGAVGFTAVFSLYYSLQYLSLSDAVAITFLLPIFTPALAFVVLRESYSVTEAACSLASLAGVLLVAKPDFLFGPQHIVDSGIESSSSHDRLVALVVGVCGILAASSVYIVLRKIGLEIHPLFLVQYLALASVGASTLAMLVVPGVHVVVPQTQRQWLLLALIGVLGFIVQLCLTAGIQRVTAGRAALISYSNMLFALLWDVLVWGHVPGPLSWLGSALIIGNAYIVLRLKPQPDTGVVLEENKPTGADIDMQDVPKGESDIDV